MAQAGRGSFSGRLGFIAAAAGSAVGLGNIWRFPYVAADNGGGAFLLIYLFCVFIICMPIMVAEISVGRHAQLNPHGSYRFIGGKGWGAIGIVGIIVGIMILSFYNVVAGWSFGYFLQTAFGDLLAEEDFGNFFGNYTANISNNLIYSFFFMVFTGIIVAGGVEKGIERGAKILMPLLVLLIIGLIIYGLTLDGAMEGVKKYILPNFEDVKKAGTWYSALSQAFFSLSLGMGAMITYGSYFSKNDSILNSAALVTITDMAIAFLSGLLIFPTLFAIQGGVGQGGPALVFVTLPSIFNEMGTFIGPIIGGLFFLLLCFAALTSTISLLEVPVSYLKDEFKMRRVSAVITLALIIFILGLPSMLSFGASEVFTKFIPYFGSSAEVNNFFTVVEDIFLNVGLPFGGLMVSLFVAYRWRIFYFSREIGEGHPSFRGSWQEKFVTVMLGFISPLVVAAILIVTILQTFLGISVF